MMDDMLDAVEELKRVDHQVYVSLKYTRTVDVITNIINRMIACYTSIFSALLKYLKEEGKIEEVPIAPVVVARTIKKHFAEDKKINDNVELFILLRKIIKDKNPGREQEYRRHVTLKTVVDGRKEIVNIDIITHYFHMVKEFVDYAYKVLEEKGYEKKEAYHEHHY